MNNFKNPRVLISVKRETARENRGTKYAFYYFRRKNNKKRILVKKKKNFK